MSKKRIKILITLLVAFFLITAVNQSTAVFNTTIDQEIDNLNLKIQSQKTQISNLKARQDELKASIAEKKKDSINLKNQLSLLESRVIDAQLEIEGVNLEVDKTNLEIQKIEIDSKNLDEDIEVQKNHIASLLKLVYKQDQVSTLEALLLNNSLAEFMNQVKYLSDANEEIGKSVDDLRQQKVRLENNRVALEDKNGDLDELKLKLEKKKSDLVYEQENKNYILVQTKSSEAAYQKLLKQAQQEQAQAEAEIASAEKLIRQRLSAKQQGILDGGDSTIAWPVTKNYITSTFHDPDYPYRKLIGEHPAIDIRSAQGNTLKAAADGYVAKVKYNKYSSNYAYIMIIHSNGLATVYGHVSAVYVSTDQYVKQGQAIGRTGGTPGTSGAGRFSSGPHLHFEVRKNGLPVNPLNYLP